jgi:hypothetical protein
MDHPRGVWVEGQLPETCTIQTIRDDKVDGSEKKSRKKRSSPAQFEYSRTFKCKYFVVISPRSPTKDISDTIIDCIPEKYMG